MSVEDAAAAGLNLLGLLSGHARVLIIDTVVTGRRPAGELVVLTRAAAACDSWTLGGAHDADLCTVLADGRALGAPMPGSVAILAAEAADVTTFRETLSPALARAVPRAVARVLEWIESGQISGMIPS